MGSKLIMGEPVDELRTALLQLQVREQGGDTGGYPGQADEALRRALRRARAELRAADAIAMETGVYVARTADQLRDDAVQLIAHRLAEDARAA